MGGSLSPVRVHLPLQQGLRQINAVTNSNIAVVVRVHLPLQQGLRRKMRTPHKGICLPVRVHLPLQQGLRLLLQDLLFLLSESASASSITTRIKT